MRRGPRGSGLPREKPHAKRTESEWSEACASSGVECTASPKVPVADPPSDVKAVKALNFYSASSFYKKVDIPAIFLLKLIAVYVFGSLLVATGGAFEEGLQVFSRDFASKFATSLADQVGWAVGAPVRNAVKNTWQRLFPTPIPVAPLPSLNEGQDCGEGVLQILFMCAGWGQMLSRIFSMR